MISLRLLDLGAAARWLAFAATLAAGAVAAGWLIAHGDAKFVAGFGIFVALLVLAVRAPGPLAALLLLAVLNGVPIVNMGGRLPGNLKFQDAAVFALGALLLAYRDRRPSPGRARIIRVATIWSACFIGWWTYEFARSGLLDGIPWLKAALYCRYYLYFAILLPLALRARFPARSLKPAGLLLVAGVILCAIGQDIQSVTGASLSWLAHPAVVDNTGGLSRLYSTMALITNTALIFGVALLLSTESRGNRWLIGPLVVLFLVDAAVQLTRANYFALVAALVVGVGLYVVRHGSATAVVTRLALAITLLVFVVIALEGAGGHAGVPVVNSIVSRASSGVSALLHSTGTVGYRESVDSALLHVLGGKWPVGLGFLHPAARYVTGAPGGTITNADVGVMNVLITMGILGVFLLYAPLFYGLGELLRANRRTLRSSLPRWILYGAVAWIVWGIASSLTLNLLFSTPGLVLTATTLAVLAHILTETTSIPGSRPA